MIIYNVGNEYNDVDRVVHHIIYHYSCNNLVHYLQRIACFYRQNESNRRGVV